MRLNDVVNLRPVLEMMAGKEIEGYAALEFAKFVKAVLIEIQNFELKRSALFQKYGEIVVEGEQQQVKILPENEQEFNSVLSEVLNKELNIEPFNISKLGIVIAPVDLVNATRLFK